MLLGTTGWAGITGFPGAWQAVPEPRTSLTVCCPSRQSARQPKGRDRVISEWKELEAILSFTEA